MCSVALPYPTATAPKYPTHLHLLLLVAALGCCQHLWRQAPEGCCCIVTAAPPAAAARSCQSLVGHGSALSSTSLALACMFPLWCCMRHLPCPSKNTSQKKKNSCAAAGGHVPRRPDQMSFLTQRRSGDQHRECSVGWSQGHRLA